MRLDRWVRPAASYTYILHILLSYMIHDTYTTKCTRLIKKNFTNSKNRINYKTAEKEKKKKKEAALKEKKKEKNIDLSGT